MWILHLCRSLLWMAQVPSWSPPFCSSCFAGRPISRASRISFYSGPARHLWRVCSGFGAWCLDGNSVTLSGDQLLTESGLAQPNKYLCPHFCYYLPCLLVFTFSSLASPSVVQPRLLLPFLVFLPLPFITYFHVYIKVFTKIKQDFCTGVNSISIVIIHKW